MNRAGVYLLPTAMSFQGYGVEAGARTFYTPVAIFLSFCFVLAGEIKRFESLSLPKLIERRAQKKAIVVATLYSALRSSPYTNRRRAVFKKELSLSR